MCGGVRARITQRVKREKEGRCRPSVNNCRCMGMKACTRQRVRMKEGLVSLFCGGVLISVGARES